MPTSRGHTIKAPGSYLLAKPKAQKPSVEIHVFFSESAIQKSDNRFFYE
jgi:hypothetical protein